MIEEKNISNTVKIYCLIDPRTDIVRYVGKTINTLKYRLSQHGREKGRNRKNNWIKSLKNEGLNPIIEIIDEVPSNDWQKHEISYIRLFKSFGANLLNEKSGGEGGQFSQATIEKIRDSQKKKIVYQYDLKGNFINEFISISEASRQTKSNVYHISSACNRIRKDCGRIMENGFLWRFKTDVLNKSKIEPYCRNTVNKVSVCQYDKDGIFIREWESASLASRELGVSVSKIIRVSKGGAISTGGFIFKYRKDAPNNENIETKKSLMQLKKIYWSEEKFSEMEAIYLKRAENGGSILKGRKLTDEHRRNISLNHSRHMLGKKHTQETRAKIKENRGNPIRTKEGQKSIIDHHSKPITQYDSLGNYIASFSSIKDAETKLGITHIADVCRGERKRAGDYIFKYIEI